MDIKNRLKDYIEFKHLSLRELERQCSMGNGVLGRISKSTRPQTLRQLEENCDINLRWLLTGEGNMLKTVDLPEIIKTDETGIKSKHNENGIKDRLIPFYDAETTGGYNGHVSASEDGALTGYIHPGGWFDGRETAAIRHVGDSMTEYPNGCVLAVREVKEKRLLVPGRNYVIETREYRVTKRVQLGMSPNTLMLYSSNEEKYADGRLIHEPFEVSFEDIIHIYTVLGYIVNQAGEFRLIKP